ncbi:EAL domain-containing protein [Burkholderia gladioli]|uniref:EAL domain protein n=3 Tax=Burkholderiaceae TaxID=119060 RepID=A0AAP8S471_BURGA|nr:EAL domain-containing protein [Burkholderia gladioli]AJW96354.1 EAL domain protein [Burkholderia gladioli]ASD82709.1 EAL domain-containing protein [Burkholderia gladioli pv. gladioli]AWY52733.1 EAL domain-containing protein [Burkholderia gladioli pv. gladioli]KAF1059815.1 Blue light- and temperature-regulated antirepressor BluF [Burkholderia gladioli]KGC13578.1 EAL domain protein [Burkholderia gladioli]
MTASPADLPALAVRNSHCSSCRDDDKLDVDITFAFQPIVDVRSMRPYGYEALVRGPRGEGASNVLCQVNADNRYLFDQHCRTTAIRQASELGLDTYLSINFLPNAVHHPAACIKRTFEAAERHGFPVERIILETAESENIADRPRLVEIFRAYKQFGFQTAIDDFGAGYAGLSLLADFQPDLIKLDIELVRRVDADPVRQHIVRGVLAICRDLGIRVIAEGVETPLERDFLLAEDVVLMQGYLFARPGLESLPQPSRSS